ncbi:hypothetical protein [Sphingobium yanoikuyae]|uniref:hypothetical protein n=1 Tax=Sphingobium yanoikuyae TaxID=13690 RepID=UPI001110D70C|nr:hypothetical protein [Sphingobium yanoikuyae]
MAIETVVLVGAVVVVVFVIRAVKRRVVAVPRAPDLKYAAKGYLQVAVTRRHAPQIDLHNLEKVYAQEMLDAGCSLNQALSARWGGTYAISDPFSNFDDAIAAYKEAAVDHGISYNATEQDASNMYNAAALLVVTTADTVDPEAYGHFLRYIRA